MLNQIKTKIVYQIKHLQLIVFYRLEFSNKSYYTEFKNLYVFSLQAYSMI